jgi:transposase InsO family protein
MNREVHVRFWESAGLQCLAPLAYPRAYGSVGDARLFVDRYLEFYNTKRPHSSLDRRTPNEAYFDPAPQMAAA